MAANGRSTRTLPASASRVETPPKPDAPGDSALFAFGRGWLPSASKRAPVAPLSPSSARACGAASTRTSATPRTDPRTMNANVAQRPARRQANTLGAAARDDPFQDVGVASAELPRQDEQDGVDEPDRA